MFERIFHMMRKEFIQVFRDKRAKFIIFLLPVIQMLVFGYAATNDVKNVPTAIYDLDGTTESRELTSRFLGSGYFTATAWPRDEEEIKKLFDKGEVGALLRLDPGFGADVASGNTARAQMILDGTDSNTTSMVLIYTNRIIGAYSGEILADRVSRKLGPSPPRAGVELVSRAWFNENLESRNYFVPGVIANITLIITMTLTSMAVVREREIGTIEQILVTPIRPIELILGKTLPFALIGIVDVVLISVVGVFWFDIPIRGNPLVLFMGTLLYLMSSLGAGLFLSTVSKTQQQAMMSTFFYNFPAILLSGFAFPIENMPLWVQWITYLNPVRYFLIIVRGVFLKGIGLSILWPEMAGLAVLGSLTLLLAASRFKKTLA
ncbi:ABC transporter permease [bacterium]|nr:MAG: ABC transporter permease [bacterium]